MEVEEASCLRHEADIVLCSSGKKKNMCVFGILKTRTHTLETHTATHFILETHRATCFTLILAPYPVSSWSKKLMDLASFYS